MLDPDSPPGQADTSAHVDAARMALHVFAELTELGGTNAVADAEGVASVSPALFSGLMHLLDAEGVAAGLVVRDALDEYVRERGEAQGTDSTSSPVLRELAAYFRERGWFIEDSSRPMGA